MSVWSGFQRMWTRPKNSCSMAWKEPTLRHWSPSVVEKTRAGVWPILTQIYGSPLWLYVNQVVSCHRFILSGDLDLDDAPYEDFLSTEEEMEQRKEREANKKQELLKKVDFSK